MAAGEASHLPGTAPPVPAVAAARAAAAATTAIRSTAGAPAAAPTTVRVGALVPFYYGPGAPSREGARRFAAFRLALEAVNGDPAILPSTRLEYALRDTRGNAGVAGVAASDLVRAGSDGGAAVDVVYGPAARAAADAVRDSALGALVPPGVCGLCASACHEQNVAPQLLTAVGGEFTDVFWTRDGCLVPQDDDDGVASNEASNGASNVGLDDDADVR